MTLSNQLGMSISDPRHTSFIAIVVRPDNCRVGVPMSPRSL